MACVANKAERYDDVISFMKEIINFEMVDKSERDLLFDSYREITRSIRSIIDYINGKLEEKKIDLQYYNYLIRYKIKYFYQLESYCLDVLSIIDNKFLSQSNLSDEDKVYFKRKKADFLRYLNEFKTFDEKLFVSNQISELYYEAISIAKNIYTCYDLEYLKTTINYSIFLSDFLNNKKEGLSLMENIFQMAVDALYDMSEEETESMNILMVLKNNIDDLKNDIK